MKGRYVVLEPLSLEHVEGLVAAASEDRSTYGLTHVPDGTEAMTEYVGAALDADDQTPFAVVQGSRVVGCTRFMDTQCLLGPTPTVTEIGSTWYARSVQRTAVNTECKLLLLTHAFETWGVERVTLKTDARNERSRNAIERLGAHFDGVLRRHSPAADGGLRDTAYFSIVREEWPGVRKGLLARLA